MQDSVYAAVMKALTELEKELDEAYSSAVETTRHSNDSATYAHNNGFAGGINESVRRIRAKMRAISIAHTGV